MVYFSFPSNANIGKTNKPTKEYTNIEPDDLFYKPLIPKKIKSIRKNFPDASIISLILTTSSP